MRAGPCSYKQNVGTKSCPVERAEYKIVLDATVCKVIQLWGVLMEFFHSLGTVYNKDSKLF